MVTTGERVAQAVLANWPFVRCFTCLSVQLGVLEKDLREAAQLLLVRGDYFATDLRMCQACSQTDYLRVPAKMP